MPIPRTVWRLPRAGSLSRLERRDESLPEPGPGEVRVRVAAIGLNFADLFAAQGLLAGTQERGFFSFGDSSKAGQCLPVARQTSTLGSGQLLMPNIRHPATVPADGGLFAKLKRGKFLGQ